MKLIENYRNKYRGIKIWVIGGGPSIDDFPLNFFDDKISIAIKWSAIVFPKCTFGLCSYDDPAMATYLIKRPHLFRKQIFTLNPRHKKNWLGKYNKIPICMRTFKPYSFKDSIRVPGIGLRTRRIHIEETVQSIMRKESCRYTSIGIVQGWAIEVALILGAKQITLVGCEAAVRRRKYHADRLADYYESFERRANLPPSGTKFSAQQSLRIKKILKDSQMEARWFAEILKPYGIEIRRYFYKTGYAKIV